MAAISVACPVRVAATRLTSARARRELGGSHGLEAFGQQGDGQHDQAQRGHATPTRRSKPAVTATVIARDQRGQAGDGDADLRADDVVEIVDHAREQVGSALPAAEAGRAGGTSAGIRLNAAFGDDTGEGGTVGAQPPQ